MRTLKNIVFIVVCLIVLLILVGFLLPREVHVERSSVVEAPPNVVYDMLISPKVFHEWSPWADLDTTMTPEHFGPESGVGAGFTWSSEQDNVGNGTYEISNVVQDQRVDVDLDFGEMGTSQSAYILEPAEGGTRVTWTMDTDLGMNPISRYFGLMMDSWVGGDYEKGLKNLQELVKNRPMWRVENIEISDTPGFPMLSVREKIAPSDIGQMLGRNYGAIMQHINANNLQMSAPPFAIYHHWPMDGKGKADVEAAIPITAANAGNETVKGSTFPGGSVAIAYYYGPYDQSENGHTAIHEWAEEHGHQLTEPPWEVYVTDPGQEPDSTKWLTMICYRVLDGAPL